jgi:hypothetical protein
MQPELIVIGAVALLCVVMYLLVRASRTKDSGSDHSQWENPSHQSCDSHGSSVDGD